MFRKGSVLVWEGEPIAAASVAPEISNDPADTSVSPRQVSRSDSAPTVVSQTSTPSAEAETPPLLTPEGRPRRNKKLEKLSKPKRRVIVVHEDLIGEAWWSEGGRGFGVLQD